MTWSILSDREDQKVHFHQSDLVSFPAAPHVIAFLGKYFSSAFGLVFHYFLLFHASCSCVYLCLHTAV